MCIKKKANTFFNVKCILPANYKNILFHISEHNKKETAITVSLQDKQCVNAIDKGNKKSYTALHIACQQGHTVSQASYCSINNILHPISFNK